MENKKIENKEKIKKGAIIILPVVLALTAAVLGAVLMSGAKRAGGDESTLPFEESTPPSAEVVAPAESSVADGYSKGLEYRSNSDGSCSVVGMGSCSDKIVRIPEKSPTGELVMSIGERAFAGSDVTEVIIPSSVMTVGESAFVGCLYLKGISVDGANPVFTSVSGVLFNREMTELVCYPSGSDNSEYVIPRSVTKISASAFNSCIHLTSVKFAGTEKQWKNVTVASGNESLTSGNLTFAPEEK